MHLVRSMSRYSQGVFTRELLNRPCSPGVSIARGDDLVADPLQFVQAEIAAILDDEFEAAGGAQSVDGRRAEGRHDRALHFLLAAIADRRGDGVGGRVGRRAARRSP